MRTLDRAAQSCLIKIIIYKPTSKKIMRCMPIFTPIISSNPGQSPHAQILMVSDIALWCVLLLLPIGVLVVLLRRGYRIPWIGWVFVAATTLLSSAHLVEILAIPAPRSGASHELALATAVMSWLTLLMIFPLAVLALRMALSRGRTSENNERQLAEQQVLDIIHAAPIGMLIVDHDGVIGMANPEIERMFGYDKEELLGQKVDVLVPEGHRRYHAADRGGYTQKPDTRRMSSRPDLKGQHKGGTEVPVEIALKPLDTADGPRVLATVADITERHQAKTKLNELNADLQDKNEELEQFVYTASHDLKSPLLTIQGFTSHLLTDLGAQRFDRIESMIHRIQEGADRMRQNIDDLLEISRIGRVRGELVLVNPGEMIRTVLADANAAIESTRADITVEPDLPELTCDPVRFKQAMLNLVSNALKYGHRPGEPPDIVIGGEADEKETRFFVRDHGPGIPDQYRDKVFALFQRLESSGDGTGIGLAIVKRVAETHGGRVWLEATPSGGVTFFIAFPKAEELQSV